MRIIIILITYTTVLIVAGRGHLLVSDHWSDSPQNRLNTVATFYEDDILYFFYKIDILNFSANTRHVIQLYAEVP
jgi:hypothetical protein